MPTFDIVNRVDLQEVDNAINNTLKDVAKVNDHSQDSQQLSAAA